MTLKKYNCVEFHMPRLDKNTQVCGSVANITALPPLTFSEDRNDPTCGCLPGCHEIKYGVEILSVPIARESHLMERTKNTTILRVYYVKDKFYALKRHRTFVYPEFVSKVGGVLSLFIGFSAISIIELLYFIFCRPYLNFKRISKQQRQVRGPEMC